MGEGRGEEDVGTATGIAIGAADKGGLCWNSS
jgi:hypothetical protein